MDTLKFVKIADVKSPCRAHPTDAGIDFFVPNDFENGGRNIEPGESVLIGGGLKVSIPKGHALIFFNKSGVAAKKNLVLGSCVSGNTIIETNIGKFTASTLTKNFCDENNVLIKSYNFETNKFEYQKCDGFRIVKKTQLFRVTFDDGSVIEGDENHFIYDEHEKVWKRLADI